MKALVLFPADRVTEPLEGVFRNTVELCVKAFKNLKSSMKYSQSLSLSDEQVVVGVLFGLRNFFNGRNKMET